MAERNSLCAGKENVLIHAGDCSVTILPHLGGKIASIRISGTELLQAPLAPYAPRTQTMAFDAGDASGWDECLPSVAACTVQTAACSAQIPDHGDLWRVAWQPVDRADNAVTLRGACFSLPLQLERAIALGNWTRQPNAWLLRLDYTLTNTGIHPRSLVLGRASALHRRSRATASSSPPPFATFRLEGSGGGTPGPSRRPVSWPIATLADGGQIRSQPRRSRPNPPSATSSSPDRSPPAKTGARLSAPRPASASGSASIPQPPPTSASGSATAAGLTVPAPGKPASPSSRPPPPSTRWRNPGHWSRTSPPAQSFSWPMTVEIESI